MTCRKNCSTATRGSSKGRGRSHSESRNESYLAANRNGLAATSTNKESATPLTGYGRQGGGGKTLYSQGRSFFAGKETRGDCTAVRHFSAKGTTTGRKKGRGSTRPSGSSRSTAVGSRTYACRVSVSGTGRCAFSRRR